MPLHLKVVTPERVVLEQPVDSVTAMTEAGEITVLPHHVPLVTALAPGELHLRTNGEDWYLAVSTGFLEVRANGEVIILADTAERAEELELAKIEEMRAKAQELLQKKREAGDTDLVSAAASLERELVRSKVALRRRGTPHHRNISPSV